MENVKFEKWIKIASLFQSKLRNALSTTALAGTIFALGFNRKSQRLVFIGLLLTCFATLLSIGIIKDSFITKNRYGEEMNFIKSSTFWFIVPFILLAIQVAIVVTILVSFKKFHNFRSKRFTK